MHVKGAGLKNLFDKSTSSRLKLLTALIAGESITKNKTRLSWFQTLNDRIKIALY